MDRNKTIIYLLLAAFGVVIFLLAGNVFAKAEDAKVDICHKGKSIRVDINGANNHLRKHDGDYKGKCLVEPTPSPEPSSTLLPTITPSPVPTTTPEPTTSPTPTQTPKNDTSNDPSDETDCSNIESLNEWTALNDCGVDKTVIQPTIYVDEVTEVKEELKTFPSTGFSIKGLIR